MADNIKVSSQSQDVSPSVISSGQNEYGNFDLTKHGIPSETEILELIRASVRATPNASDNFLASEKAIRDAIDAIPSVELSGTEYTFPRWNDSDELVDSSIKTNANNQLILPTGSYGNPSLTFDGKLDSGVYLDQDLFLNDRFNLYLNNNPIYQTTESFFEIYQEGNFRSNISVLGTLACAGELTSSSGQVIKFDQGSISNPGLTLIGDENTGLCSLGADEFSFVAGGSARATVSNSGWLFNSDCEFDNAVNIDGLTTFRNLALPNEAFFFANFAGTGITQSGLTDRAGLSAKDLNGAGTSGLIMTSEALGAEELAVVGASTKVSSLSTGIGSIKMADGSARDNTGFLVLTDETGVKRYVPYYDTVGS